MTSHTLSIVLGLATLAGCDKSNGVASSAVSPTTHPAGVPPAHVLTLATSDDIETANKFEDDRGIKQALAQYPASSRHSWKIVAARDVGEHVLLWLAFPAVADGGADVVYSKKERRIVGEFKGGERG